LIKPYVPPLASALLLQTTNISTIKVSGAVHGLSAPTATARSTQGKSTLPLAIQSDAESILDDEYDVDEGDVFASGQSNARENDESEEENDEDEDDEGDEYLPVSSHTWS
jgi:hypothetical protein